VTLQNSFEAATLNARRGAHRLALAHLALSEPQLEGMTCKRHTENAVTLQLATARALTAMEGIGSPAAERHCRKAHRLQGNLTSQYTRFEVLWELWVYYLNSAPLAEAAAMMITPSGALSPLRGFVACGSSSKTLLWSRFVER